jgi:hypothetical protein
MQRAILRHLDKLSDIPFAYTLFIWSEEIEDYVTLENKPKHITEILINFKTEHDTFYDLLINFPTEYPFKCPMITIETDMPVNSYIYHPYIIENNKLPYLEWYAGSTIKDILLYAHNIVTQYEKYGQVKIYPYTIHMFKSKIFTFYEKLIFHYAWR